MEVRIDLLDILNIVMVVAIFKQIVVCIQLAVDLNVTVQAYIVVTSDVYILINSTTIDIECA